MKFRLVSFGKVSIFLIVLSSQFIAPRVFSQIELWEVGEQDRSSFLNEDVIALHELNSVNTNFEGFVLGENISIPLPNGVSFDAVLEAKKDSSSMITGSIPGDREAVFMISNKIDQLEGFIVHPSTDRAYEIVSSPAGYQLLTRHIDSFICHGLHEEVPESEPNDIKSTAGRYKSRATEVPIFNSLPSSEKVLYLDFDGEEIVDEPLWVAYNYGEPITNIPPADSPQDGDPSSFSPGELELIETIWKQVAEDFSVFDVNVTTDSAKFEQAPRGYHRQKIIINSDNSWYGVSGVLGVADVGSFYASNGSWKDAVAFSFHFRENQPLFGSTVVSHELGHALYLEHKLNERGFADRGMGKWGHIMGYPFNATSLGSMHHWSIGTAHRGTGLREQDDIEIITEGVHWSWPGLGLRPDRVSNFTSNPKRAAPSQEGLINSRVDKDVYFINLEEGQHLTGVADSTFSTLPLSPNLDLKVVLRDPLGIAVLNSNPVASGTEVPLLNAPIDHVARMTGRYTIELMGTGFNSDEYFYTNHGSIGRYKLVINSPEIPELGGVPSLIYLLLLDEESEEETE